MATTRQRPSAGQHHALRGLVFALVALMMGAAAAEPVAVTDDAGREVRLDEPAERLVSLAPHATELLYAVGAGEDIVGAVDHSDYPQAAKDIPRVGGYDAVDIERILGMEPDLVVAWGSGNGDAAIERLEGLDLTVFVNEPRSLADIAHSLERLGALTGNGARGSEAAEALRERREQLDKRYADRPAVDVFYEVWHSPLMTVSDEHLISEIIRLCGGRNVFRELSSRVPTIDTEAVLGAEPEAIIASGMGAERPDWLDAWKDWQDLPAVERGNLFHIPPSLTQRASPRLLDGAEQLCEQLETARERRPESP